MTFPIHGNPGGPGGNGKEDRPFALVLYRCPIHRTATNPKVKAYVVSQVDICGEGRGESRPITVDMDYINIWITLPNIAGSRLHRSQPWKGCDVIREPEVLRALRQWSVFD